MVVYTEHMCTYLFTIYTYETERQTYNAERHSSTKNTFQISIFTVLKGVVA